MCNRFLQFHLLSLVAISFFVAVILGANTWSRAPNSESVYGWPFVMSELRREIRPRTSEERAAGFADLQFATNTVRFWRTECVLGNIGAWVLLLIPTIFCSEWIARRKGRIEVCVAMIFVIALGVYLNTRTYQETTLLDWYHIDEKPVQRDRYGQGWPMEWSYRTTHNGEDPSGVIVTKMLQRGGTPVVYKSKNLSIYFVNQIAIFVIAVLVGLLIKALADVIKLTRIN